MKKILVIICIFCSLVISSKTAEEHYKDTEVYSQKSKQGYILAGVALVFVIVVKFINRDSNSKEKENTDKD